MIFSRANRLPPRFALSLLCFFLWEAKPAHADEGIPALLQFAEHYHGQRAPATSATESRRQEKTAVTSAPKTRTGKAEERSALMLRQTLRERDATIEEQQKRLVEQEKKLQALQGSLNQAAQKSQTNEQTMPAVNGAVLHKFLTQLRSAVTGTPDSKRSAELVATYRENAEKSGQILSETQQAVEALTKERDALQQQLAQGKQDAAQSLSVQETRLEQLAALQKQIEEKNAALTLTREQLDSEKTTLQSVKNQLSILKEQAMQQQQHATSLMETLRKQHKQALSEKEAQRLALMQEMQKKQDVVAQKETELAALRTARQQWQQQKVALQQQTDSVRQSQTQANAKLEVLPQQSKFAVSKDTLAQPEGRQAYAIGTTLGKDILTVLNERKSWGMKIDLTTIQAGVMDTLSGRAQLSDEILKKSLNEAVTEANKAHEKIQLVQYQQGEKYITEFRKQKNVKASPSGFWYRIDYPGDTPITKAMTVDIVVKELLTDGTVIQDMDLNGKVLSQPFDKYPPLFQEAIKQLRNHGEITLVVPPELAYGKTGYPPKVPPNATLIYNIRIDSVNTREEKT